MHLEDLVNQFATRGGELYQGNASIIRAGLPTDKAFLFKTIDRGRDRATGEHNLAPDGINRERALTQKHFEYCKVRQAKAGSGNALRVDLSHGMIRLHEDQPEMRAGKIGEFVARIAHSIN